MSVLKRKIKEIDCVVYYKYPSRDLLDRDYNWNLSLNLQMRGNDRKKQGYGLGRPAPPPKPILTSWILNTLRMAHLFN